MLHFNALLEPISAEFPSGADLTFSNQVDAINKARQFDDPTLDQGEWITDIKEADWQFVYDNCTQLLGEKTKDLRIASWLVEAATKTRGFEGLAAGFELIAILCDRYWTTLHPVIDDGDIEQRVGNLAWLVTRSVQLVKEIPLTDGRDIVFSWAEFEAARVRANAFVRSGENPDRSGKPDLAALEIARRKSSKAFYEGIIGSVVRSQTMLVKLESSLDIPLGADGPSFTILKETLETITTTLQRFGADVGLKSASGLPITNALDASVPISFGGMPMGEPIKTRDEALGQLRLVAEFFRSTEPHSPVAYLAEKAATWGDMPLHSWLKTVVKDPNSLAFIEEMLGVKSDGATDTK